MNKSTAKPIFPWDWNLTLLVLFYTILPGVYGSYQIYLVGNILPTDSGLAIASQWQFIQVIFEVIQEALVLPLFFFLGTVIREPTNKQIGRIKTAFAITILIGIVATGLLQFSLPTLIDASGTDQSLIHATEQYLRLKVLGAFLEIIGLGLWISIEALNLKRLLILIILAKSIMMIALDSLFFGGYSFSMNLGIQGAALSSIMVDSFIILLGGVALARSLKVTSKDFKNSGWFQDWSIFKELSIWIGSQSLIKNLAYWFMVLRLINELGSEELSGYYLCMHLLWSFALIPILVICEATRVQLGNHNQDRTTIWQILRTALLLTVTIIFLWGCLWPFRTDLLLLFSQDKGILSTAEIALEWLILPYGLMAINLVVDSLFYGLGKTKYLTWQALITNGTVYLIGFLCYIAGIWEPTFEEIMLLFGAGILVDSVMTVYFGRKVMRMF